MDKDKLAEKLDSFFAKCNEEGKALENVCYVEAYPGFANTSYFVQLQGEWMDKMDCSDALDILIPILFETSDPETRKYIFALQIIDSTEDVNCEREVSYAAQRKPGVPHV
ncbi:MAG: hypothetical protein ABIV51_12885 [Saprospiraceae bacterium]